MAIPQVIHSNSAHSGPMAENDDAPETPDVTPEAAPEAAAVPQTATRWRDTLWTFRSVLAVAVASVLIGGTGGALVVAATGDGHDRGGRHGRMVWMDGGPGGMRRGMIDGGLGGNWQVPPNPQFGPASPPTPSASPKY